MYNIFVSENILKDSSSLSDYLMQHTDNCNNWRILFADNYEKTMSIIQDIDIDAFILEIGNTREKGSINGISLGYLIRSIKKYSKTPIIFLTDNSDYMEKAINEIHCYAYYFKPYTTESILNCLVSVLEPSSLNQDLLEFKDIYGVHFYIKPDNILYITKYNRNILIVGNVKKYIISGISMIELQNRLPDYFVRCHKEFVINIRYITNYDKTTRLIGLSKKSIPLGRAYKADFEKLIANNHFF